MYKLRAVIDIQINYQVKQKVVLLIPGQIHNVFVFLQ